MLYNKYKIRNTISSLQILIRVYICKAQLFLVQYA